MRKLLTGLALVVSASGCATLASGSGTYTGPLDAYLLPGNTALSPLSFHVNKPAHVAIFHILPGQGASLVYPTPGAAAADGGVYSGLHSMGLLRVRNASHYLPASGVPQPRFYMLVASEQPLQLDEFGPYGDGLSRAMGVRFASNAYSAMERLVELTVPNVASEDWVVDYYVEWPDLPPPAANVPVVQLTCDGRTYYVRADLAAQAFEYLCPATEESAAPDADEEPGEAGGTPEQVEPRRRAPVDVSERIASTQLQDPERWSALSRAAAQDRPADIGRGEITAPRRGVRPVGASRAEDGRPGAGTIGRTGIGASRGGSVDRSPPNRAGGERRAAPARGSAGQPARATPRSTPSSAPSGGSRGTTPAPRENPS